MSLKPSWEYRILRLRRVCEELASYERDAVERVASWNVGGKQNQDKLERRFDSIVFGSGQITVPSNWGLDRAVLEIPTLATGRLSSLGPVMWRVSFSIASIRRFVY